MSLTRSLLSWSMALAGGLTSLATQGRLAAAELDLGAAIPAVTALDQNGEPVDLAAAGSGYVLVYFYPKADTPGCTRQACSLRDAYQQLEALGVRIFGVSGDTPEAQRAFAAKHRLPFRLLADTESRVMDAFGVPHTGHFASRQAFLFHEGRLVWRDLKASTEQQAADVLAVIANR